MQWNLVGEAARSSLARKPLPPVATENSEVVHVEKQKQADRILSLLQANEIVPLLSILNLYIASYTRRIHELREQGWIIETIKYKKNRTAYRLLGHLRDQERDPLKQVTIQEIEHDG